MSPPSSSMAVKHRPWFQTLKKWSRVLKPCVHEETSPYLPLGAQDQQLGVKQDQFPCGSTGTSSGNCQETDTCMVWAFNTPQQSLQNHPSGHLGWVMPWLAEEMLEGQHQRVDIPDHGRTAHKGVLQKSLEQDLCWIVPYVHRMTQSVNKLYIFIYIYLYKISEPVKQQKNVQM